MTSADAVGTTLTFACLFCTVRQQVTLRPFQSFAVSFAMSSPIFFGDSPSGPIFGASDEAAPTSPPTARMYTYITAFGSNFGGILPTLSCPHLTHSLTRSLTHSLAHSLTHSLAPAC